MQGNPVGWFEIYVDDMERAKAFYQRVFDIEFEQISVPSEEGLIMQSFPSKMENYGAGGALVKMPEYPAGNNSILVYFSCEDCAVEESRVDGAGGEVLRSKMSIGEYGFIALFKDTEGNMLGLHSQQ
ncbi:VOC family protein [Alteromonas sp. ASW11-130]|uniref:VOC family protein n=1 Tax=Alteromonas sp. ASW11-130 TaxID=3015775 RepID=UPI0022427986|nr:VOC family protein [Alteromonas sp. ASW11-130]MCW8092556.1 VOC family protein [Alteromonas sp. ASW11-130]